MLKSFHFPFQLFLSPFLFFLVAERGEVNFLPPPLFQRVEVKHSSRESQSEVVSRALCKQTNKQTTERAEKQIP